MSYRITGELARENCISHIGKLPVLDGKKHWEVVVKLTQDDRTVAQKGLYWVWVREIRNAIADATGQYLSEDRVHKWLAAMFLGSEEFELFGKIVGSPRSTEKLKVGEMAEYLTQIEAYALTELDTQLPHPEDKYYLALMGNRRYA